MSMLLEQEKELVGLRSKLEEQERSMGTREAVGVSKSFGTVILGDANPRSIR